MSRTSVPPLERMAQRSARQGACLVWLGTVTPDGYGQIGVDGKKRYVHQLGYEAAYGPIPPGLVVCHSCDNPPCWEALHLEAGTVSKNTKDGWDRGRRNRGVGQ